MISPSVGFLLLSTLMVLLLTAMATRIHMMATTDAAGAKRIGLRTLAFLSAWLSINALLANAGFFRTLGSLPPRPLLAPTLLLVVIVVVQRSRFMTSAVRVTPAWWPVALQTFRVPVELLLFWLHQREQVPVHMTFEGRNFDIVVGLTAPVVAWCMATQKIGARWVWWWNVASLFVLLNIVVMAMTSLPGPQQLNWGGVVPMVITEPFIQWLPGFLVPLAVFGHISSFRLLSNRRHPA
jgi:hypothetical protein